MDTNINYIAQGTGAALVFQHGLTANVKQVESLLSAMEGVRLMAIDCPGHGSSPLPDDYLLSFNQYANDVIDFLDRQQIDQAIFGGISMGSGIALNIALRYPQRVKALILVRPAWLDQSDPENLRILLLAAKLINESNGEDLFQLLPEFKSIELLAVAQSILGVFSEEQQPGLEKVIDRLVGDRPFTSMEQLNDVQAPCLLLGNHHDPLHPYEMAEKIHQSIPESVLRKLTSRYIDNDLHGEQVRNSIQQFIQENKLD